jgi:hypothetical protein
MKSDTEKRFIFIKDFVGLESCNMKITLNLYTATFYSKLAYIDIN